MRQEAEEDQKLESNPWEFDYLREITDQDQVLPPLFDGQKQRLCLVCEKHYDDFYEHVDSEEHKYKYNNEFDQERNQFFTKIMDDLFQDMDS